MKIIHITPSYKPAFIYGGPTMSVAKLCEELEEQRTKIKKQGLKSNEERKRINVKGKPKDGCFELQVLTTTANGRTELNVEMDKPLLVDGVPVTYFKRWTNDHTHFSPSLLLKLNKLLREARHDNEEVIIHVHAWWNLVSVLSCLVAKWHNVPTVLSPRGMLNVYSASHNNSKIKKLLSYLVGDNLLKYCFLHLTSEKERRELPTFLNQKKNIVISNLVGLQKTNTVYSGKIELATKLISADGITSSHLLPIKLIFLSRIDRIKGIEGLFNALNLLKINYTLTIVGTGDESYITSLKQKAKILNIESKISWLGQVNSEKFNLLAEHDLLILPSYSENFANVVIESLSVGTPVLISEQVGLASYVKERNLGLITKLQPEEMAENIEFAAKDIAKRNKIRISAPETILKDFDSKTLINQYINLYECVLNGHPDA